MQRTVARPRFRTLALLAALAAPLACGSDPMEPDAGAIAGAYAATEFTVTESGTTTNLLQQGASLQLVLAADRTTASDALVGDATFGGARIRVTLRRTP